LSDGGVHSRLDQLQVLPFAIFLQVMFSQFIFYIKLLRVSFEYYFLLFHNCTVLQQLLRGSAEHGVKKIRVCIPTDGHDVLDGSSVRFVQTLEKDLVQLQEQGVDAQIASGGGGRMYVTMDRHKVSTCMLCKIMGILHRSPENIMMICSFESNQLFVSL